MYGCVMQDAVFPFKVNAPFSAVHVHMFASGMYVHEYIILDIRIRTYIIRIPRICTQQIFKADEHIVSNRYVADNHRIDADDRLWADFRGADLCGLSHRRIVIENRIRKAIKPLLSHLCFSLSNPLLMYAGQPPHSIDLLSRWLVKNGRFS